MAVPSVSDDVPSFAPLRSSMRLKRAFATSVIGRRFMLPPTIRKSPPAAQSRIAPSGGVIAICTSPDLTAAVALSTAPSRLIESVRPRCSSRPVRSATWTGSQLNPPAPAPIEISVIARVSLEAPAP